MSSFLCFVCHNSVSDDTNEEIREKYRDVVGMNLCLDSHMCYICCHLLKKLWFFKSICYKRALEYPVLFTEKGTPNLQSTEIQIHVLCPELCMPNNDIQNLQDNYNSNDYVNFDHNDTKTNIYDITTENTELNSVEATTDIINENHDNYDYNDDYVNNDVEDVNEEFIDEEINVNNDFVIENNGNTEEIKLDSEPKKKKSKRTKKKHFEKIILTKEEQKTELEQQRKSKKYTQAEFKCFPCALGFLFKDTYQAHMMRHEESNGEFKCVTCKLRFATQALLRSHVVLHTERYKCTKCGDYFRTRQVQRHAKLCHNKVGESASCHLCGRVFSDSKALQQHLKRFHISKTSNKKYSCNVCGNNFNNPAALRIHMLKHIQRKFSCDQCAAIFTSPYNLTQHKKKHETSTDDKLYYCETCGVGYTTRKSLLAHKRNALVHQNREYICPICNRTSPNDKALNYHISSVHTGSKEYGCTSCSARYSNRKSLVRHIRSHTNPTPVKMAVCHLCGNSFKGKNKLNRHLKEVCEKNKLEEELASYYEQNPI